MMYKTMQLYHKVQHLWYMYIRKCDIMVVLYTVDVYKRDWSKNTD